MRLTFPTNTEVEGLGMGLALVWEEFGIPILSRSSGFLSCRRKKVGSQRWEGSGGGGGGG